MKIMIVFGTRPEAIKMAPVINELKRYPSEIDSVVCVTAQHREMLDQALNLFEAKPDCDLDIMSKNQSLFEVTTRGLQMLERVLRYERPDIVLVQGDTTTTFIASLAAYYLRIKIGHIEAGLRTGDKFNPFPEEINRKLTDCLSDLYFASTKVARRNLLKERVKEEKIFVTGNTVIDTLLMIIEQQSKVTIQRKLEEMFLRDYGISANDHRLILVTGHRRESFGQGLENICKALKKLPKITMMLRLSILFTLIQMFRSR